MTNFEKLKSLTLEELAIWLDNTGAYDDAPWTHWLDNTYCVNCDGIKKSSEGHDYEFSYCEEYGICRFFQNSKILNDCAETVRLWLNEEYSEEKFNNNERNE